MSALVMSSDGFKNEFKDHSNLWEFSSFVNKEYPLHRPERKKLCTIDIRRSWLCTYATLSRRTALG
jgi:hypothetical protein